jgi:hypothetical protein
MMAVIDKELSARKMGLSLTPQERLEVFGSTRLEDHADQAEQASIHQRLRDAMNDGVPATDLAVMDLAEEHRQHIHRWLHDCGYETHRELACRSTSTTPSSPTASAPGMSRQRAGEAHGDLA